ncbi:MAG: hypothetical protein HY899_18165 [Deltaproteobacteria bacterium]|nr:hypothetical protein [Deltaproteobacteria bacterium]
MTYTERVVILSELAERLRAKGSWCGETHLQKSVYLLQHVEKVPLGFEFVLYRHGPFSFDLREELSAMRGDGFLRVEPQSYPYGPRLMADPSSAAVRSAHAGALRRYEKNIEAVADIVGAKGVADLEKLATALFVSESAPGASAEIRAVRINEMKPHVSYDDALAAVSAVDDILLRCSSQE